MACSQGHYREELIAKQFERYVCGVELPPPVAEWARDTLGESLDRETHFHNIAVDRLNAELARIKHCMNQV